MSDETIAIYKMVMRPFAEATCLTLSKQFKVPCKTMKPYLKAKPESRPTNHCALMRINGEKIMGAAALSFSEDVFLKILNTVFAAEYTEINKEIEDGATEMLNIIFGQARTQLNKIENFSVSMAIPTIIRAKKINIDHLTPLPAIVIPFESSAGDFFLQVGLEFQR